MITQTRLKERLHYNPDTGVFTWKVRPGQAVHIGDVAGCLDNDGYRIITVDGRPYKAHRLAVLYMDGYLPENTVDHENRIVDDNRYKNLREASRQCQSRNRKVSSRSTSKISGIYWSMADSRWKAGVCVNSERKHLGSFTDFEEAVYHRYTAEVCLGFPDCDINSAAKQYIDRSQFKHDNALPFWGPM